MSEYNNMTEYKKGFYQTNVDLPQFQSKYKGLMVIDKFGELNFGSKYGWRKLDDENIRIIDLSNLSVGSKIHFKYIKDNTYVIIKGDKVGIEFETTEYYYPDTCLLMRNSYEGESKCFAYNINGIKYVLFFDKDNNEYKLSGWAHQENDIVTGIGVNSQDTFVNVNDFSSYNNKRLYYELFNESKIYFRLNDIQYAALMNLISYSQPSGSTTTTTKTPTEIPTSTTTQ